MRIYLDMCSIQRPLDTKTQPRIAVEAEAILGVLMLCEAGQVELMTSDALHLASAVQAKADYFCTCDDRFLKRAKAVDTGQTKVVSPLELITVVTQ